MNVSPLQLIKDGILEDDMEKVTKGYRLLTGEIIERQTQPTATESESEQEEASEVKVPLKELDFSTKPREQDSIGTPLFARSASSNTNWRKYIR